MPLPEHEVADMQAKLELARRTGRKRTMRIKGSSVTIGGTLLATGILLMLSADGDAALGGVGAALTVPGFFVAMLAILPADEMLILVASAGV